MSCTLAGNLRLGAQSVVYAGQGIPASHQSFYRDALLRSPPPGAAVHIDEYHPGSDLFGNIQIQGEFPFPDFGENHITMFPGLRCAENPMTT